MIIKDKLEIQFPEGFEKMRTDSSQFPAGAPEVCCRDPQRRMIVAVGFRRIGVFPGFMLKTADVAKVMENSAKRMMQPYGFQSEGSCEKQIGDKSGNGFRYRYTADTGVRMYGESCVIKQGRDLYYFHLYSNEESEAENVPVWTELLASAKWI